MHNCFQQQLASFSIFAILIFVSGCGVERQADDRVIENAILFLGADAKREWRPDLLPMIQFLHRKFPEAGLAGLESESRERYSIKKVGSADFALPLLRLVNFDHVADKRDIQAISNRIIKMSAEALHCDRNGLPNNFVSDLTTLSAAGGYTLTHAVLAAQWAIENSCLKREKLEVYLATASEDLVQLIENPANPHDLIIESITMLYYTGQSTRVEKQWLDKIIQAQQQDGGWWPSVSWTESHSHTTFLALWALLEARYPDAGSVPMIPRP